MSVVLGIETSCDETAASVVVDGKHILSNVLYSQVAMHEKFGGVFPELASRRHLEKLLPIVDLALKEASMTPNNIDLIACSGWPGLIGALLMGVNCAKSLAFAWNKPFVAVNHVEAHLYAAMMDDEEIVYPCIGVVVSGGHTALVLIHELGRYEEIGKTVDDAVGEAFDKVARMLKLGYPGGPKIEALAKLGKRDAFPFTSGRVKEKPYHFSFSGLKTQVLYTIKGQNASPDAKWLIQDDQIPDIAASFQEIALGGVVDLALKAAREYGVSHILVGGGVSNNIRLREIFFERGGSDFTLHYPPFGLSLDNAAMIAGLGYHTFNLNKKSDSLDFAPHPTNKGLLF